MDLKIFFKPDKDKIITSVAIIIITITLIIIEFLFTLIPTLTFLGLLCGLVLMIIYLPLILFIDIPYIFVPGMRPDMDIMTSSQFRFHFIFIFLSSCTYVYLLSSIIVFMREKRRKNTP